MLAYWPSQQVKPTSGLNIWKKEVAFTVKMDMITIVRYSVYFSEKYNENEQARLPGISGECH